MQKKSVISLISYDAEYLPNSIKRYYNYVDEIILGLDKDRITWSNNVFSFNESDLWYKLQELDVDGKISVIEENFHQSDVAIENDNYERNFLKEHCSHDWIFSFDADEYLVNPKEFFYNFCPIVEKYNKKVDICMTWATPYKQIDNTLLVIAEPNGTPFFGENQGIATHRNNTYTYARWTDISASGSNRILSPLVAIHWSLCREKAALHEKIHNIGHSDIVENDPFYSIWDQVTLDNYHQLQNFKTSGLGGAQWPSLFAIPADEIDNYIINNIESAYR